MSTPREDGRDPARAPATPARSRPLPFLYRFLIGILGALLTLLLIWLLGFILRDIDRMEGPDYQAILEKHVDATLRARRDELVKEKETLAIRLGEQRQIQKVLRESRETSRTTMTVLQEFSRRGEGGEVELGPELQRALTESLDFFLTQQKAFSEANDAIARHSERQRAIDEETRSIDQSIETQTEPAREEYDAARRADQYLRASLKLAFLVPLLIATAGWSLRKRTSPYRVIPFASLGATAWKVGAVIHEHFPSEIFKYIAIGASLAVTLAILIKIIQLVTTPRSDWQLRQVRDAYQRHRCPVCADPIRRGPLRHAIWTRKGPVALSISTSARGSSGDEQAYTCPSCGQALYEPCERCETIRPALLPYCPTCGDQHEDGSEKPESPEREGT